MSNRELGRISEEEKVVVFEEELARIYDPTVREFTRLCIVNSPDYIYIDCPTSSSGKYHPLDELCSDGTIIHTKKVFTMAYELVKALDCENSRDLILCACIVHDLRKRGVTGEGGHTVSDHPNHAANLIDEVQEATGLLSKEQHTIVRNCVGFHYGPWSEENWLKPMTKYTPEELCVFLSDYTVSKRFVRVDYRREAGPTKIV
jgi:hypothetical protein